MVMDPAMVTLQSQRYPGHQELPVLSHSSHPGVQVASDPPPATTLPISPHTLRRLFCHGFKRLIFFSTDYPNSPADDTPQWHELFSSVRISRAAATLAWHPAISEHGLAFSPLISWADQQQLSIHHTVAIGTCRVLFPAAAPFSA